MKVPTFMKTIRFRLSVWYAALLVILAVLIVLWINLGFRYAGNEIRSILGAFRAGLNGVRSE